MTKKNAKKDGVATKNYVFKTVSEATDAILTGMQEMFDDHDGKLEKRFNEVDKRFDRVENGVRWVKDDIDGLKGELTIYTPRRDHEKLKARVQKLEKLHAS
ncbi:hypothetical protein HYT59_00310 [Candidatus Woesebacteria bacterium]|nr:hypothetical protein [Candidatus Woesebacteria bacterium]